MTIDEAIKHCLEVAEQNETQADKWQEEGGEQWGKTIACRECAADHRQLAEWLTELKEAKRLLKLALNDFETIESNLEYDEHCVIKTHSIRCDECPLSADTIYRCKWRYADEALALIGEDANVPASADDTNVGHKSGDWISVNDRLPEAVEEDVNGKIAFSKSVLVYLVYDNGFTYITNDRFRVDSKSWLHEIPGEGCKVTHWMPLPEPPKDGDTNG